MRKLVLLSLVIVTAAAVWFWRSANDEMAPPTEADQIALGRQLYAENCASCHGAAGAGDGPVAPLINIPVPDLTRLAQRAGGTFPTEDVHRTIDGRWDKRAHGARDMPVWGWQFYDSYNLDDTRERARVDATIDRLVVHLRSIQKE